MRPRIRKGFTLIELIVVVVIIAILSTVFVATYRSTITRTREAAVEQTARSLAKQINADGAFTDTDGRSDTNVLNAIVQNMNLTSYTFRVPNQAEDGSVVVTGTTAATAVADTVTQVQVTRGSIDGCIQLSSVVGDPTAVTYTRGACVWS